MADNEVLDALMSAFNSAHYQPLELKEITERLQRSGFYKDMQYGQAASRINNHLCLDGNNAHYPFLEFHINGRTLWGLSTWLPPKRKRVPTRPRSSSIEPPSIGVETQHTISINESEIRVGGFPLRYERLMQFILAMDDRQLKDPLVTVECYGSENFVCYLDIDSSNLEGKALAHWYKENGVHAGDMVSLTIQGIRPLLLRIFTEWDRDADAYRRYTLRKQAQDLPRTDLSIRDLVWLFLNQTMQIAHRSEISRAVLESRPEVSERSVDSCLSANPYLFIRSGDQGYWGLREWGIDRVSIITPRRGENPLAQVDSSRLRITVPLSYVLETIHGEDLIYRVLQANRVAMSYSDIVGSIANYLGFDKQILARASFLDVDDGRITRLQDGKFMLRENIERALIDLTEKKNTIQKSMTKLITDHAQEIGNLKDELIAAIANYETKLRSIQTDRDSLEKALSEASSQINAQTEQLYNLQKDREQILEVERMHQEEIERLTNERNEARDVARTLRAQQKENSEPSTSYARTVAAYFNRPLHQIIIDVLRRRHPELPEQEKSE